MTRHTRFVKMLTAAIVVVGCLAATANAAADPNGTWKWTVNRNGQDIETTLTLKVEGEKLTGTVSRNDMKTDITDGTFKDSEVAFQVERERNGQKIVIKYKGKVEGDAIKGKIDFEFNGESRSFDWDAKREKK